MNIDQILKLERENIDLGIESRIRQAKYENAQNMINTGVELIAAQVNANILALMLRGVME